MTKLKGVVIGCGNFGTQQMRALSSLEGAELIAGVDVNEARQRAAGREFGVKTFSDYREALDLKPDFAYVCSVNSCHKEQVCEAARRGIHVYCEKPIALTMKDADEMCEVVRKSGIKAVMGFGVRLSPLHSKILQMIKKGELGKIISVWIHTIRGYGLGRHPVVLNPHLSGGWIIHHTCHAANWFLWNFGPIKEVCCRTNSTLKGKGREEIIWASFKFARGVLGSLYESVGASQFRNRGIVGTKGTLILESGSAEEGGPGRPSHVRGDVRLFREAARRPGKKKGFATIQHELKYRPLIRSDRKITEREDYSRQTSAQAFLDCIRRDRPVWAGMKEGREVLRVTLAMKKSAEERRPVLLAEIN